MHLVLLTLGLALLPLQPTMAQPSTPPPSLPILPDTAARTLQTRALKDSILRHAPDSPLLPQDRNRPVALNYFPIDPTYRVVGQFHTYGRRRRVDLPTNTDEVITMERFGRLLWHWEGKKGAPNAGKAFWFEVYRNLQSDVLEVFFKDASNGDQTYGGGRYAPLTPLGDGYYLLDFNMAYNPYCAYNPAYVCPMPPPQNRIPFPILAGEKSYGLDLAN